ncbi:MAG: hypothetical protein ACJ8D8_20690 [Microvirga sp.]
MVMWRARALERIAVMPGLGPGIHDYSPAAEVVDGRPKAGHDGDGRARRQA